MRGMTVAEISAETLSKGLSTANCIYASTRDTVAIMQHTGEMIDIPKGSLIAVAGCGGLHISGSTYFRIGDKWGKIPNVDVVHYANPIMERVPEGHPTSDY